MIDARAIPVLAGAIRYIVLRAQRRADIQKAAEIAARHGDQQTEQELRDIVERGPL
jgi:transcriptional regulator of NAD metabolism